MAPKYKLTYFDFPGLGEPIRFLLSYGGLEFEDNRISKEDWPALKPKTPLGQMPILEVDGKVLHQSVAIARYLGNIVGLVGKTPLENWEIDAVMDTILDLKQKLSPYNSEQDEAKKKVFIETMVKETFPFYLKKFDAQAKKNGGYLAAGKLTWVDLYFSAILDFFSIFTGKDIIAEYPNLSTVRNNVLNLPQIKAWLAKRPKTKLP